LEGKRVEQAQTVTAAPVGFRPAMDSSDLELTILIPCLNEAETLARVVDRAQRFLQAYDVAGEVVVADNGSTDGSPAIATSLGARVVHVSRPGYGAALMGGIEAARGRYVAMGDADCSYDFMGLMPFLEQLRAGVALVMGNRFLGGIGKGAMPRLHRYLGNPVLSFAGRLFFAAPIGDFHCGLRAFDREAVRGLGLSTPGMEFASEMVVRAQLAGFRISEVPTTLSKDGRSRPPHLRSWRDGWRHLKFLLLFAPRWLYVYPGLALIAAAALAFCRLLVSDVSVGGVRFGVDSLLFAGAALLIGVQVLSFGLIASLAGARAGYWTAGAPTTRIRGWLTIDKGCLVGGAMILMGALGAGYSLHVWAGSGFGDMNPASLLRVAIPAVLLAAIGLQVMLTCFLVELLDQPTKHQA
jgi:glycosyltransferase involved in cell wall biosynthesis